MQHQPNITLALILITVWNQATIKRDSDEAFSSQENEGVMRILLRGICALPHNELG
jgi:hypothetical protein